MVVYETGNADPTPSSSPVPTPSRFEAAGLRYRFLAYDPLDLARTSAVKEWTAKLRLKYQLHDRGDHLEVELLALPRTGGIDIRYTTDGSSPVYEGAAIYDGPFRVPPKCRVVLAAARSPEYGVSSDVVTVPIRQSGKRSGPAIDTLRPARWTQPSKLDDSTATWDFIRSLESTAACVAFDLGITAASDDGTQVLDFSGARESGYRVADIKSYADSLSEIAGGGTLRMTVGALHFETGQALLDWLRVSHQSFNALRVVQ